MFLDPFLFTILSLAASLDKLKTSRPAIRISSLCFLKHSHYFLKKKKGKLNIENGGFGFILKHHLSKWLLKVNQ